MNLDKNQKRPYSIEPYNSEWVIDFKKIKEKLEKVFGSKAQAIEHIGSTSIPGMRAKPLIDVLVIVDAMGDFSEEKEKMGKLGYQYGENYIAPNTLLFFKVLTDGRKTENIHVCDRTNFKVSQFLGIRDFLRKKPEWAEKYSSLKEELYKKFPNDYPAYREGKSSLLRELDEAAKNEN